MNDLPQNSADSAANQVEEGVRCRTLPSVLFNSDVHPKLLQEHDRQQNKPGRQKPPKQAEKENQQGTPGQVAGSTDERKAGLPDGRRRLFPAQHHGLMASTKHHAGVVHSSRSSPAMDRATCLASRAFFRPTRNRSALPVLLGWPTEKVETRASKSFSTSAT